MAAGSWVTHETNRVPAWHVFFLCLSWKYGLCFSIRLLILPGHLSERMLHLPHEETNLARGDQRQTRIQGNVPQDGFHWHLHVQPQSIRSLYETKEKVQAGKKTQDPATQWWRKTARGGTSPQPPRRSTDGVRCIIRYWKPTFIFQEWKTKANRSEEYTRARVIRYWVQSQCWCAIVIEATRRTGWRFQTEIGHVWYRGWRDSLIREVSKVRSDRYGANREGVYAESGGWGEGRLWMQ